jgi:uncharacterized alkaline shock family protein YloU
MTANRLPGRSLVTRRAVVDIVRPVVAGSYGVTGLGRGGLAERIAGALGLADPGIRISFRGGLSIDLHLTVAYGLPVAEVARQADSAVRYAIRRAIAREVDRLTIHVGGMRYQHPAAPPSTERPAEGADAAQAGDRGVTLAASEAAAAEAAAAQAAAVEAAADGGGDAPA